MLIALRAILLVLFIAAPFGEQEPTADSHEVPAGFAADAVLSCPLSHDGQNLVGAWTTTAGNRATAHPDAFGGA